MPLERTDSDLEDVWSDESGELRNEDHQLTEFDFNIPKKTEKTEKKEKKEEPPRRRPLISDLEAPVLGAPPPAPTPTATLEAGSLLIGSSASSLLEKDSRTIIGDAEGAAIAHAVSRSLLTNAGQAGDVRVPEVLERDDVKKVLVGKPSDDLAEDPSPLEFEPIETDTPEAPAEEKLELAFDPRVVSKPSLSRPAIVRPSRPSSLPIRGIVLALLAIVIIAFVVRLLVA